MDWNKLLDKFFVFVAALIPGSSVVLVAALHRPNLWKAFSGLDFPGYQAKIATLILVTLVAGLTVNEMMVSLAVFAEYLRTKYQKPRIATLAEASGQEPQESSHRPAAVPPSQFYWRRENWRKLLMAYLGSAAPENLSLVQDPELANDGLWQEWWGLLCDVIMLQFSAKNDPQKAMMISAELNFGGAGLIILIAALWTPALRHWWIILPSVFWVSDIAAFYSQQYKNAMNPESAHYKQMEYLQMRVCKGEQPGDSAQ